MADQDPTTPLPGGEGNGGNQPEVAALAQYIKDLSVENPSSPQVFQWQEPPQLDVQFNINVNRVADDVHEVVLKIDATARSQSGVHFVIDLSYGGLFALRNLPEEALGPFLLVEAPRLLFPFARQVIASAVQDAGFPPLMLDPIDFGAVYMSQAQAAQGGEDGGENGGSIPGAGEGPSLQ
ncbi:protein-export chaperone SecB [Sphingomonas sp. GCM10030256]|uniref:protein-export chaperone SecB n=1 Tax=Sphingomonas sp. GCM10030256 TaxID=3273427 RepID=UPI0036207884